MDSGTDMPERGAVLHMLGEMKGMLQALLTRMDGFDRDLKDTKSEIHSRLNNHGERLQALELTKAQTSGGLQATRIIMGLIWTVVLAFAGLIAWLISSNVHIDLGGGGG